VKALAAPPSLQTPKSRPALGRNVWDQIAFQCPRPWRGLSKSVVASTEFLKHQSDLSLTHGAWRPRLRRDLRKQCRIVPRVSRNAKHREGSKPPMGRSLYGLSFPWISGNNPADGSLGFWRSRLPPQSFLPVGIGEATPLATSFGFFDFASLHSLSYLWVSGRQRH